MHNETFVPRVEAQYTLLQKILFLGVSFRIFTFQILDPYQTFITNNTAENVKTYFERVLMPELQQVSPDIRLEKEHGRLGGDITDYYYQPAITFSLRNFPLEDKGRIKKVLQQHGIFWPLRFFTTQDKKGVVEVVTCRSPLE
jgi:hypothetical protein